MKMPKEKRTYCPKCKKHTEHEVLKVKKRKASEFRAGQRQFRRILKGYGSFPRALPSGSKPTKKVNIMLRCKTCKKSHNVTGFRIKMLSIEEGA